MDFDAILKCLNEIAVELDADLLDRGWRRLEFDSAEQSFETRRWTHEIDWKRDVVNYSFPKREHLEAFGYVSISFDVQLPIEDRIGFLDTVMLSDLCGLEQHDLPKASGLFKGREIRKFRERLLSDFRRGMSWFDGYQTVEQCLAKLEAGDVSYGKEPRQRAYEFLKAVKGE